jgi:hypothetical protein
VAGLPVSSTFDHLFSRKAMFRTGEDRRQGRRRFSTCLPWRINVGHDVRNALEKSGMPIKTARKES